MKIMKSQRNKMVNEKQLSNGPEILELHTGINCQLNCVFCYRQNATYEPGHKLICEDCLIKLIADFAAMGGSEEIISGGLEPFSRPKITCLAIQLAHEAGLKVKVYTNGTSRALSQRHVQELLALSTVQVRFSIHAVEPRTYHLVTDSEPHKSTLYEVIRNVQGVMDARPKKGAPRVGIVFVAVRENINELVKSAEFWRDFGADFFDLRFDVATDLSAKREILQEVDYFRGLVEAGYFCPMKVSIGDYSHGKFHFACQCIAPFRKIVVDPFGIVWSCCLQAQAGYRPSWARLGSLTYHSLGEIVTRIAKRFPRRHCNQCTPWEAKFNLHQSPLNRSRHISSVSAVGYYERVHKQR
jgi:MoaA/NifB/PqqE/SkfB family radical SAM enzyme